MRIARQYEIKSSFAVDYVVNSQNKIVAISTMGILFCIDELPKDVIKLTCLRYGLRPYLCSPAVMMSVWEDDED